MTIRSRIALAYGAGVALTLLVVGVAVWWQMGNALQGSLDTALQARAAGVISGIENGQSGLQESDQTARGVFAALFSADGSLIEASFDAPKGIRPVNGMTDLGGRHYVVHTASAPDGSLVVTGADLQPVSNAQASLAWVLAGVGLAAGLGSLLGGWLLAGRALRPLARLSDEATSIGPGDLDRRLATPARRDEIGRLTLTLNAMLDRIAESVERQRLFVAMASHELRTPLAALRAELDVVQHNDATLDDYRQAVLDAQADAMRLTSLSTSLLELAAAPEDARAIAGTDVRLRELVESTTHELEALADRHLTSLSIAVTDGVVWVDRIRIEHAVTNLVTNASVHGGPGEVEIHARIDGRPPARMLSVEVLDRGPGLGDSPPDELFVAFRRGSGVVGAGSGLGLATVASAVRAHGGTFGAENRAGGGARFWFRVPCDPSAGLPTLARRPSAPQTSKRATPKDERRSKA